MYRLRSNVCGRKAGSIVYEFKGHDYGCSSMDTLIMGHAYIAVTEDAEGEEPFFTVAMRDLEKV